MQDLRVTLTQTILHWEDIKSNLAMFSDKLASQKGQTDLVILPEMFSTGFTMNAEKLAEPMDGPTMQWMADTSSSMECVVTGSIIIKDSDRYFNRLIWMKPDGQYNIYDKRHLLSLAHEEKVITPGKKKLTVELNDWKVSLQICYDLRFPVWSRNTDSYDFLIYVANWPEKRSKAWRTLLQARAIENQCYVAGVNRVGEDENGYNYLGDSCLIDPMGEIVYSKKDIEEVSTQVISKNLVETVRGKLPFLQDGDRFYILER